MTQIVILMLWYHNRFDFSH